MRAMAEQKDAGIQGNFGGDAPVLPPLFFGDGPNAGFNSGSFAQMMQAMGPSGMSPTHQDELELLLGGLMGNGQNFADAPTPLAFNMDQPFGVDNVNVGFGMNAHQGDVPFGMMADNGPFQPQPSHTFGQFDHQPQMMHQGNSPFPPLMDFDQQHDHGFGFGDHQNGLFSPDGDRGRGPFPGGPHFMPQDPFGQNQQPGFGHPFGAPRYDNYQ